MVEGKYNASLFLPFSRVNMSGMHESRQSIDYLQARGCGGREGRSGLQGFVLQERDEGAGRKREGREVKKTNTLHCLAFSLGYDDSWVPGETWGK